MITLYPIIDKEKTGKRIKELMKERNVSVKDVRDYLLLESVQSIYYWFTGRNIPTIDNLYALSTLLQVPIDEMICGSRKIQCNKFETGLGRLLTYYGKIHKRCITEYSITI